MLTKKIYSNRDSLAWNHISVGLGGLQNKMNNFSDAMKESIDNYSNGGMTIDEQEDQL